MHFEVMHNETVITPPRPTKIKGVIILTDNRERPHLQKSLSIDYRGSDFKCTHSISSETEVDPLQFCKNQFNSPHDDDMIQQLNRRVLSLEEKVKALETSQGLSAKFETEYSSRFKRKNRRKFRQLVRNQVCVHCQKIYGSETSLKYHIKLKHSEASQKEEEAKSN